MCHQPPNPQILSMKEASNKKNSKIKSKKSGRQQDMRHEVVHHDQGEHYQRKAFRVSVIMSGPVGKAESSRVQKRNPNTISKNNKFLGLSLLTMSLVIVHKIRDLNLQNFSLFKV